MNRQDFLRATALTSLTAISFYYNSWPAAAGVPSPAEFVEKAGIAGNFEILSSELMLGSTNPEIKPFAQKMISDHKAAAEELKAAAGGKYPVPDNLDKKHRELIHKLKAADNREETYVKMQVKAHQEAVELFGKYIKEGSDAELQAFAAKTLPTLQMHLDMIEKISSQSS
ncbi:DUF4142 domain-containing protein [Nordella sp. HKS 07]|uniref:DUF4142 domain-containing protein n=1 Tax=Nordella sp. HKS 07 TaxID=2712222 RepID=UPI0013E17DA2|nr:DUF4142 domain-containing protein [Nordella sp. HKS 07]QIG49018.1 DUF4142 domain-containing protein [Nordella sp. HKS 07]